MCVFLIPETWNWFVQQTVFKQEHIQSADNAAFSAYTKYALAYLIVDTSNCWGKKL